ncbi:MAG TPA: hypothetical protein DEP28_02610 [Bacteroidetes bacterium]|nr:hypothetical protein [Bacteroidota bacterium]HCN36344.1 hypothetical protein [Bacteroidota bacterium]HRE42276.1 hypothetical protein [Ignavibacteria bacterium]
MFAFILYDLLNELWGFVNNPAVNKLLMLGVIFLLMKMNKKLKYVGIYLMASDYATEKVTMNGKGDQYKKFQKEKIHDLLMKDDFENEFKPFK